jgi:paired amphipathic helix protein Sin3a
MKDLSRDDVDAKKAAFKKDLDEVKAAGDDDDVEMEEA